MAHWLDTVLALLRAETSDLRELARIAGADPNVFYRGITLETLDTEGQDLNGLEFGDSVWEPFELPPSLTVSISWIRGLPHQEERLSALLRTLLENYYYADRILSGYGTDRAKYANTVLDAFHHLVAPSEPNNPSVGFQQERREIDAQTRLKFARVLWQPFSRGMPGNRVLLLLNMAKHLSEFKEIREFLQTRLKNSRSIFLSDSLREEISRHLGAV